MAKDNPTRSTRFPEDLDEEFEAYRDMNEMNNSEALRELVRAGIEEKKKDPLDDRPDSLLAGLLWDARHQIHLWVFIMTLATLGTVAASGAPVTAVFIVIASFYALTVVVGAVDALVLDRAFTLRLADCAADVPDEVDA